MSTAEAARLDHRDLNRDLHVFATDPLAGAGLPLWLPDGAVIREELQALARDLARADGCQGVYSPVLGKRALYERSGHWAKFSDDMFPPMAVGGDELVLRPANCPHHALIYASAQRSWRELPLRLNELAAMFRAERSGVLSGLSRVRQINLDDTHVFCRPDQVAAEAARGLRAALRAQEILGLPVDYVRLSLRDDSPAYLGSAAQWQAAEAALRDAAAAAGLAGRGLALVDAARRGRVLRAQARPAGPRRPRAGGDHRDRAGRLQPARAVRPGLRRAGRVTPARRHDPPGHRRGDGAGDRRAARAVPGPAAAVARAGAGVRAAGQPGQDEAARRLADGLLAAGLRPRLDAGGSLGARVRHARQRRDHLIAVVGEAEAAAGTVQVTDVAAGFTGAVGEQRLIRLVAGAYAARRPHVDWPPEITAV